MTIQDGRVGYDAPTPAEPPRPEHTAGPGHEAPGPAAPARKRRSKDIGTDAERAVVRYLQATGWPSAERRALRGTLDAGDITGTPGICWEVKGGRQAHNASDGQVSAWLAETLTEKTNADAAVAVLVLRRQGVGPANAGRWWALMPAYQFECLTAPSRTWRTGHRFPLRMLLADAVQLLRTAGYGDPSGPEVTR